MYATLQARMKESVDRVYDYLVVLGYRALFYWAIVYVVIVVTSSMLPYNVLLFALWSFLVIFTLYTLISPLWLLLSKVLKQDLYRQLWYAISGTFCGYLALLLSLFLEWGTTSMPDRYLFLIRWLLVSLA